MKQWLRRFPERSVSLHGEAGSTPAEPLGDIPREARTPIR
jgi:hypothetical protein